jgi:membrane protease YdiL (CAAX protease family)
VKIPRTVFFGLLVSLPIFGAALLPKYWAPFAGQNIFVKGIEAYGMVVFLSVIAMVIFGEGRWNEFGFQKSTGSWWKFIPFALLIGAVSTLAVKISPGKGMEGGLNSIKPSQLLLLVIIGSAAEELFFRGWLQGFLWPLKTRFVKLGSAVVSVPVLTGALAFGAMHLPKGISIDLWTAVILVGFTTTLGLLAGIIRERTGSLLPSIATHLAGNAGGVLGSLVYLLIRKMQGVPLPM